MAAEAVKKGAGLEVGQSSVPRLVAGALDVGNHADAFPVRAGGCDDDATGRDLRGPGSFTRTGRGGTGVLYQTPDTELRFDGPEAVGGMLGVVQQGLLADPTAFSLLRTLRLSPEQLAGLRAYLERLVLDHPSDSPGERYVVYTAAFRA